MITPRQRTATLDVAMAAINMRKSPGRWVKIPTKSKNSNAVVSRQKRGDIPALPPERFEARSVNRVAYARYIGGDK